MARIGLADEAGHGQYAAQQQRYERTKTSVAAGQTAMGRSAYGHIRWTV